MIQAAPMVNKPGAGPKPQRKPKKQTEEYEGFGRPPVPDSEKRTGVMIALSPSQKRKLIKLADEHGASRSGYIGQLIDELELTATQLKKLHDYAASKNRSSAAMISDWIDGLK